MPTSMSQLDLFHDETRGPPDRDDRAAGAPRRVQLDAQSWVEHEPGWLPGHAALFGALRDGVNWHAERRAMFDTVIEVPRLTAAIPDDGPSPPALVRAHDALERRYGRRFESVRLAWYRDGRDSVAMHGDRIGRRIADTVVAILSLGAPRRFLLKPAAGGSSLRFDLGGGDLLVMGGACQAHLAPRHTEGEVGRPEDQHPVPRTPRIRLIRPRPPDGGAGSCFNWIFLSSVWYVRNVPPTGFHC